MVFQVYIDHDVQMKINQFAIFLWFGYAVSRIKEIKNRIWIEMSFFNEVKIHN